MIKHPWGSGEGKGRKSGENRPVSAPHWACVVDRCHTPVAGIIVDCGVVIAVPGGKR